MTKILEYPKATAAAMLRPSAADLPRPRAAVMATVLRSVCSDMASTNFNKAFAWKGAGGGGGYMSYIIHSTYNQLNNIKMYCTRYLSISLSLSLFPSFFDMMNKKGRYHYRD